MRKWFVFAALMFLASGLADAASTEYVIKGAFIDSRGEFATDIFPGNGKVYVFESKKYCEDMRATSDKQVTETRGPDFKFKTACIPFTEDLKNGLQDDGDSVTDQMRKDLGQST